MRNMCLECSVKHHQPETVEQFKTLASDKGLLSLLPHRLIRNQHVIRIVVSGTPPDTDAWLSIAKDCYPWLINQDYLLS